MRPGSSPCKPTDQHSGRQIRRGKPDVVKLESVSPINQGPFRTLKWLPVRKGGDKKPRRAPAKKEHATVVSRKEIQLHDRNKMNSIIEVNPRASEMIQMFSLFLHTHSPPRPQANLPVFRRSYLLNMAEEDVSQKPLLQHAMIMVGYAHIGGQVKDDRFLNQARHWYGRTLRALIQQMQSQPQIRNPLPLLEVMMLLAIPNSVVPRKDLFTHYEGAQSLITGSKEPSAMDSDALPQILMYNLYVQLPYVRLAQRRTCLTTIDWSNLQRRFPALEHTSKRERDFYHMLIDISALAERTESSHNSQSKNEVEELWNAAISLQTAIKTYFAHDSIFGEAIQEADKTPVHLSDAAEFDMEIEEHCFMPTNPTVLSFLRFRGSPCPTIAPPEMGRNLMLALISDCTLLRILHFHPWIDNSPDRHIEGSIIQDATGHATLICRMSHALSLYKEQGLIAFLSLLSSLAQNFFGELYAFKEFGWCQALRLATNARLSRVRSKQPRTLCRLEDLEEGIGSFGKFRSHPILRTGNDQKKQNGTSTASNQSNVTSCPYLSPSSMTE